jgi:signal transduction histidine kinase/DNA-binding response OmpR family regulator
MDVTATEPEHSARNVAADGGARILVVEDEHLVALDIQLRVERMGHRPVVTYSAEDALKVAADTKLDLVLMDIKLKGNLDGIDAARQLRALYDLPIIYLTAYADNRTLERARQTEPYGYVLKPFQERELKAAIDIALEKHGADKLRTVQQHMQRFLADASARLATTLDYGAVAVDAAGLVVPRHADWCTIHLKESSDLVAPYTYTCPNGTETDGHNRVGHLIESVESTGKPELLVQIPDAASLVEALGAQHLDVLRELGARSALCVPFIARDHVIGALLLVAGRARPRYSPSDLAFIEDFAHRLAMALDNAILYRAAERAIRMRDDVLAIVSHDLRTPLGTILLQAEKLVDNAEFSRLGVAIMRSAHRMNRLIGDLLDASAINAGQLTLDRRVHGAADIAREALDMFRSQSEAHGITLVADLPDELRRVSCDRDRIVQVLSNLLANALKFTPRGGTVTVRVEEAAEGIHFEVQDTGPGIAPEQLPYLFDRFWRTQQRSKGAGLGLFISRGIIAAHGSTLLLESKLCIGSRFYFVLPEPDRDGTG